MLPGFKEIIIILFVLIGLFFIPLIIRMRSGGKRSRSEAPTVEDRKSNGLRRLAILLTGIWVALAFVFLSPLSGNVIPFFAAGILPVALVWGVRWVVLGFKSNV